MALLNLLNGQLAYGAHPLLDGASFSMEAGERIGLIGRNGTGKSSLLNVIAGRVTLDDGEMRRADGLKIALVEQEPQIAAFDANDFRVKAAFDRLGVSFAEKTNLSGGE